MTKSPSLSALRRRAVDGAGLTDLIGAAEHGARIGRSDLLRALAARDPYATAALADLRRARLRGVVVTAPLTLRVRPPGVPFAGESHTLVSHPVDRLDGIAATEATLAGTLPRDLRLGQAVDIVSAVRSRRPDLTLRAFSPASLDALARRDRSSVKAVATELRAAGLATLGWHATTDASAAVDSLRGAVDAGLPCVAAAGYEKGGVDSAFVDRLCTLRGLADQSSAVLSFAPLPSLPAGAGPLQTTSGLEDVRACALVRLATAHLDTAVTLDADVFGRKQTALLLSAGGDDVVGAQAALSWAPPTDDGPRPLNADRLRRDLVEARRSPEPRDALFRTGAPTCG